LVEVCFIDYMILYDIIIISGFDTQKRPATGRKALRYIHCKFFRFRPRFPGISLNGSRVLTLSTSKFSSLLGDRFDEMNSAKSYRQGLMSVMV
jgi:hypothetical protein